MTIFRFADVMCQVV